MTLKDTHFLAFKFCGSLWSILFIHPRHNGQ